MLKKISSLPFQGTPEQEAQLKEVIQKHMDAVEPLLIIFNHITITLLL